MTVAQMGFLSRREHPLIKTARDRARGSTNSNANQEAGAPAWPAEHPSKVTRKPPEGRLSQSMRSGINGSRRYPACVRSTTLDVDWLDGVAYMPKPWQPLNVLTAA